MVIHKFPHYIYWLGPILGSTLAAGFYMLMKILEYETVNPAQDADRKNDTKLFAPNSQTSEKPQLQGFDSTGYGKGNGEKSSSLGQNRGMSTTSDGGVYPAVTTTSSVQSMSKGYNAGPQMENGVNH